MEGVPLVALKASNNFPSPDNW